MASAGRGAGLTLGGIDGLYPIRTVSRVTGVNAVTLRAWERRYGLIQPQRTDSGHRVYTDGQIDEIRHILELIDGGMSIGQVGHYLEAESASRATDKHADAWESLRRRLVTAVQAFDEQRVDDIYNEAMALYSVDIVTTRLIVPVLLELGRRWQERTGTVAEEHFFSGHLRNKLGARIHHHARRSSGPRLILACLEGEHHEIGCLLFALSALDRGFGLVYLGANVPIGDLPGVQSKTRSGGIVLAGATEPGGYDLSTALTGLVAQVDVPVFIGGRVCSPARDAIERSGAIVLGCDLPPAMKAIELHLGAELTRLGPGA